MTADSDAVDSGVQHTITRRRALAAAGSVLAGGTGLFAVTRPARASVTMGTLAVTGDDATLAEPPASIDVHVTGEWEVTGMDAPEMTEVILQLHVDGVADDLVTDAAFGASSGSFDMNADLFDHGSVSRGDLLPDAAGEENAVSVLVRIVVRAVDGGEIRAETFVEDTVELRLTKQGVEVRVGGEGTVQVVA